MNVRQQTRASGFPAFCDAVVDLGYAGPSGEIIEGARRFAAVQNALSSAPKDGEQPYVIFVKNGTYHEKVEVDRPYVTLIGESRDRTILTFDAASGTVKPDGTTYGTAGSATLSALAPGFTALHMTIENAYDYMGNLRKPDDDPTKTKHCQGVALKTDGKSDKAVFHNVWIRGFQDTLFANAGTQYYEECRIQGNVDFIFGAGRAVFERCTIVSLDRGMRPYNGYITAASTPVTQKYGFLFTDCKLLKDTPELADGSVVLGRPWQPKGDPNAVGNVVFKNCAMDRHISAEGWVPMHGFPPEAARLYEHGSTGPGALAGKTRRVLSDMEAEAYIAANVLDGWNPASRLQEGNGKGE